MPDYDAAETLHRISVLENDMKHIESEIISLRELVGRNVSRITISVQEKTMAFIRAAGIIGVGKRELMSSCWSFKNLNDRDGQTLLLSFVKQGIVEMRRTPRGSVRYYTTDDVACNP